MEQDNTTRVSMLTVTPSHTFAIGTTGMRDGRIACDAVHQALIMMKQLVFVLLTTLILSPAIAEETPTKAFRVAIEVTVPDDELQDRVAMYLRNELRSLGDVEVTDDNPDFKLFAMVTEMKSSTGGRIAYVLGISITRFFPDGYVDSIISAHLSNVREVAGKLEALAIYENQFISVAGAREADLIKTVTNSVARINAHILQPQRNTE